MCAHYLYVSIEQLEKFKDKYYKDKNKTQRFGQAFINTFFTGLDEWTRRPWPELFYETDDKKANAMIINAIHISMEHDRSNFKKETLISI